MEYENGDKYKGQWKDGKKDGKGEINYDNGANYNGDWKEDLKSGRGKNLEQFQEPKKNLMEKFTMVIGLKIKRMEKVFIIITIQES